MFLEHLTVGDTSRMAFHINANETPGTVPPVNWRISWVCYKIFCFSLISWKRFVPETTKLHALAKLKLQFGEFWRKEHFDKAQGEKLQTKVWSKVWFSVSLYLWKAPKKLLCVWRGPVLINNVEQAGQLFILYIKYKVFFERFKPIFNDPIESMRFKKVKLSKMMNLSRKLNRTMTTNQIEWRDPSWSVCHFSL